MSDFSKAFFEEQGTFPSVRSLLEGYPNLRDYTDDELKYIVQLFEPSQVRITRDMAGSILNVEIPNYCMTLNRKQEGSD